MKIIDTKVTHEGFHRLEVRTFEDEKHDVIFDRDILVAKDACAAFVYHKGRRQFAFVKQFRGGANMVTTECVAGIMDGVESPIDSITREIKEELGCDVIKSKYVDYVYQGPASTTGVIHLFLCVVDGHYEQILDDDEYVEIKWVGVNELPSVELHDMKSIILLHEYNKHKYFFNIY